MNKIEKAFETGKAFIAFITCADPDLDTTEQAVLAAVENGADLIELNIPFSDPTGVDGAIQKANLRALQGGVTTDKIFTFVENLRKKIAVPLVFSTYANVIFSYGTERFISACERIGIDGLIVPDLPYEEQDEFLPACEKHSVILISMISSTSKGRIQAIATNAKGFLYIMTCPGGSQEELAHIVTEIRQFTQIPCAVCVSACDAPYMLRTAALTDGIIEDATIVALMEKHGSSSPCYVGAYVQERKALLKGID